MERQSSISASELSLALAGLALFLIAFDAVGGWVLRGAYQKSTVNPIYRALLGNPETVVLGSSTAMSGLSPSALGGRAYNASENGQTIFYAAAFLRNLPLDHSLKRVIFGFDVQDFIRGHKSEFMKYLKTLAPLAEIDSELMKKYELNDPLARYKYVSGLYPFQGRARRVLFEWWRPKNAGNGFTFFEGYEKRNPNRRPEDYATLLEAPEESYEALRQLVDLAGKRNLQLIVVSPPWRDQLIPARQKRYSRIMKTAQKIFQTSAVCNLTEISSSVIDKLIGDETKFFDRRHLNGTGAEIYSRFIAQLIANRCGELSRLSSP
ncbi:MAG: hypothetical protein CMM74_13585 [Rhodospirillaceae bacterium]|nr:hypothetical protein [Rhodospirillaceae bacterium]